MTIIIATTLNLCWLPHPNIPELKGVFKRKLTVTEVMLCKVDILGVESLGSWRFGSWYFGSWHFGSWQFEKLMFWELTFWGVDILRLTHPPHTFHTSLHMHDRQSQKHMPHLLTNTHMLVQRSLRCMHEAYTLWIHTPSMQNTSKKCSHNFVILCTNNYC